MSNTQVPCTPYHPPNIAGVCAARQPQRVSCLLPSYSDVREDAYCRVSYLPTLVYGERLVRQYSRDDERREAFGVTHTQDVLERAESDIGYLRK